MIRPAPSSTLFPYTTLFRSEAARAFAERILASGGASDMDRITYAFRRCLSRTPTAIERDTLLGIMKKVRRSEEHTSELQSRENLVCRLLLEKKKIRRDSFL